MFGMHILLCLACAEDAETQSNRECFIAYDGLKKTPCPGRRWCVVKIPKV